MMLVCWTNSDESYERECQPDENKVLSAFCSLHFLH